MTVAQFQIVSDIGRKTAADRIATAACDLIIDGSEGAATMSLQSGSKRGTLIELTPDRFETLWNLTMDIVAAVRVAFDDRRDLKRHEIRNMVFALMT